MSERVLVIPRTAMEVILGKKQGFIPVEPRMQVGLLMALLRDADFQPRNSVEGNPKWKQIIPYVVLWQYEGSSGHPIVFSYQRTSMQGEVRLHGKRSIGVGGHVNPIDRDPRMTMVDVYQRAMARELDEEVDIPMALAASKMVGLLNYEEDPVGRDHLGLVHLAQCQVGAVIQPKEPSMDGCFWETVSFLQETKEQYETWSQEVIGGLEALLRKG